MVVGVREVARGEKERAGRERRGGEGLSCQGSGAEKGNPTFSIALLKPHCPALHPILSLWQRD